MRIPSVPNAKREGQQWVEAVRKLREILQATAQSEISRDFFDSERSEASKKRTKQGHVKTLGSFYTAWVESSGS